MAKKTIQTVVATTADKSDTTSIAEVKRPKEYVQALARLTQTIKTAKETVMRILALGKQHNIPNKLVKEDLFSSLDSVVSRPYLRSLMGPEYNDRPSYTRTKNLIKSTQDAPDAPLPGDEDSESVWSDTGPGGQKTVHFNTTIVRTGGQQLILLPKDIHEKSDELFGNYRVMVYIKRVP